jgi:predicted ArsR family transcriptional regulator
MKDQKQKSALLENLKKNPIVQVCCERSGVSRPTYYRWRQQDKKFAKEADEALREGVLFINDIAESQLLASIKDKNITSIIYWLKNRHPSYAEKMIISGKVETTSGLTSNQKAMIKKALKLSALSNKPKK